MRPIEHLAPEAGAQVRILPGARTLTSGNTPQDDQGAGIRRQTGVTARRFRTAAYVRFGSAATRLGNAQRAAQFRPSPAAEVSRADALTSLRDCRVAFIIACGYSVSDIDPRTDLISGEAAR